MPEPERNAFYSSNDSKLLLRNNSIIEPRLRSPICLMSVYMLEFFKEMDDWVIWYFCDTNKHHSVTVVEQMMKSLVRQVIGICTDNDVYLDYDSLPALNQAGECQGAAERTEWLCHVFQFLIRQLPGGSILYCVVDQLSAFEAEPLDKDKVLIVCEELLKVKNEGVRAVVVKVLVTGRGRDTVVKV
jgi:hypothetical protein